MEHRRPEISDAEQKEIQRRAGSVLKKKAKEGEILFRKDVSHEAFDDDGNVIAPDPDGGIQQYQYKFRRPVPESIQKWRNRKEEEKDVAAHEAEKRPQYDGNDVELNAEGEILPPQTD